MSKKIFIILYLLFPTLLLANETLTIEEIRKVQGYLHKDTMLIDSFSSGFAIVTPIGRVYELSADSPEAMELLKLNIDSYVEILATKKEIPDSNRTQLSIRKLVNFKPKPKENYHIMSGQLIYDSFMKEYMIDTGTKLFFLDYTSLQKLPLKSSFNDHSWLYSDEAGLKPIFRKNMWKYFLSALKSQVKFHSDDVKEPYNFNITVTGELNNRTSSLLVHNIELQNTNKYIGTLVKDNQFGLSSFWPSEANSSLEAKLSFSDIFMIGFEKKVLFEGLIYKGNLRDIIYGKKFKALEE